MKTIKQKIIKPVFFLISFLFFLNTNAQFAKTYTKLLEFSGVNTGSSPEGSLISVGTFLYGMTTMGGANDMGTIFKIKPDGTEYAKLLDFAGNTNGRNPYGSLIYDGTFFYGMTAGGGTNRQGTVFKIMADGTGYVKLFNFSGTSTGSSPYGSLIYDGTFLYGMTFTGGLNNLGTIFKILPNGTGYTKLLDFAGTTNGSNPYGDLISDGTFLYGTTAEGGINNIGTLFKIMPNGTGYVKLLDFSGTSNGARPWGSLIYDGTFFYGTTVNGGTSTNSFGTLFKIMPDGTGYKKLFDFDGIATGNWPTDSLVSDGTFLYGTTNNGGADDMGTLFKIRPDGSEYEKLIDFNGASYGRNPKGSLISDGTSFYGMTVSGGSNGLGTLFKYQLASLNTTNYNKNLGAFAYPNPVKNILNIQNPENNTIDKITITDLTGKKVLEQKPISNTINVEQIENGIYLLELKSDGKNDVLKFIKQ
jgi:uncharacterized repeat protein (TIGR03803 family)